MKPRVYLAGKIEKNCWRCILVPRLREHLWEDGPLDTGTFVYVGPFFVGCDHGCYHGPNRHGALHAPESTCSEGGYTQRQIHDLDTAAIENADMVLAYITSQDCIGTIYEMGWAAKSGRRLVIAFAPGVATKEFWFPATLAAAVHNGVTPGALPGLMRNEVMKTQTTLMLGGAGSFDKAKNEKDYA